MLHRETLSMGATFCCKPDCEEYAEYAIYPEPSLGVEDFTRSCGEHLVPMLESYKPEDRLHRIHCFLTYPIENS